MSLQCLLHSSFTVICWFPVFCGPASLLCILFFSLRVKVSLAVRAVSYLFESLSHAAVRLLGGLFLSIYTLQWGPFSGMNADAHVENK